MKRTRRTIEIGIVTIFWVFFALVSLKFLGNILDIFILVFISILIALALCPLVDALEKKRINRSLSSILILIAIFSFLVFSAVSIIIPLVNQTQAFIERLPSLIENIYPYPINLGQLNGTLSLVPGQVYRLALGTFSG